MPISEVYNEDNMIGMARYPDKFFDLAIVDPPYGINAPNMQMGSGAKCKDGRSSTGPDLKKGRLNSGAGKLKDRMLNRSAINWDNSVPPDEYFIELDRVSVNQIIWGGNYFDLGPTRCVICWDKMQPWENFSQLEMAWTSFDKTAALFRYRNTRVVNNRKKIHPTEKPIALYRWLLSKYANKGDKILDTHMGSQNSRIAAFNMGFDYTGFEIDPLYFNDGCKQFELLTKQTQLF